MYGARRAVSSALGVSFATCLPLSAPLGANARTWQLDSLAPWPRRGGDNKNQGRAVKSLPSGYVGTRARWIFGDQAEEGLFWETPDLPPFRAETVEGGVVIASDNKVYVPTSNGRLFCLNASTGAHIWTFDTDQPVDIGSRIWTPTLISLTQPDPPPGGRGGLDPPISTHRIVFACGETLYCMELPSAGTWDDIVWTRTFPIDANTNHRVIGSPAVGANGTLYVVLSGNAFPLQVPGAVAAVNAHTGAESWRYNFPQDVTFDTAEHTSPAVGDDGTIYVCAYAAGSISGTLYALNPNGTLKWRYFADWDDEGPGYSRGFDSPRVSDGAQPVVYFGTQDAGLPDGSHKGTVWAVHDVGFAQPLWKVGSVSGVFIGPVESSPALDRGGNVYVGCYFRNVQGTKIPGKFVRTDGQNTALLFASTFFDEYPVIPPGVSLTTANVDATVCVAEDAQGNFLRVFQTEENGYAHALDALGNELWGLGRERVRRTDLISVAMGRDGTVYFGTGYGPRTTRVSRRAITALCTPSGASTTD